MDISLVIAKVLGVYLVVSGLFLIFRGKTVPHLLKDFFGHPAVVYLTGVILIFLSTLMLLENNIWDGTWRTIITIFLWLVLLKGLAYIFVPDALQKFANKKLLEMVSAYGLIAIIAGVSLFYLG
ncbi:MAG: hypothetical protein PHD04_00185 [Candidatus Pacebacteria bacterium]|nr:hypothetical protein [Candidatus Paceibacterota bacterium]